MKNKIKHTVGERKEIIYKGMTSRLTADFLAATIRAKRYCPSAEGKQLVLQCHS